MDIRSLATCVAPSIFMRPSNKPSDDGQCLPRYHRFWDISTIVNFCNLFNLVSLCMAIRMHQSDVDSSITLDVIYKSPRSTPDLRTHTHTHTQAHTHSLHPTCSNPPTRPHRPRSHPGANKQGQFAGRDERHERYLPGWQLHPCINPTMNQSLTQPSIFVIVELCCGEFSQPPTSLTRPFTDTHTHHACIPTDLRENDWVLSPNFWANQRWGPSVLILRRPACLPA